MRERVMALSIWPRGLWCGMDEFPFKELGPKALPLAALLR